MLFLQSFLAKQPATPTRASVSRSKRRVGGVLLPSREEGMILTCRGSFCKCKRKIHNLPKLQKVNGKKKGQYFKMLLINYFILIHCGNIEISDDY